ncbi:hypothetical protein BGZ79_002495 [Entomortierella chlamydospora]|nr:hypothetical protein BGZ79_002495 [Entomortierella chlamydospora]
MIDRDVFHGRSIMRPTTATPATRGAPNRDDVEDEDEDEDGDDGEENDGNSDGDNEGEEASDEDEDGNWDIPLTCARSYCRMQLHSCLKAKTTGNAPMGEYHIFQDPVFKFQLFYDFKEQLLEQMASATSPHSDSLAANAPSIHQRFQDVSAQIRDSASHSENLFKSAMEKMDQGFGVMTSKMKTVDKRIKALKENTARKINQGSARTWKKVINTLAKIASQPGVEEDEDDEETEEGEEDEEEEKEDLSPVTSNTNDAIETLLQGQATPPPPQSSQDTQARFLIETMDIDVLMEKVAKAAIGERKKNWQEME